MSSSSGQPYVLLPPYFVLTLPALLQLTSGMLTSGWHLLCGSGAGTPTLEVSPILSYILKAGSPPERVSNV